MQIEDQLKAWIEEIMEGSDCFLVSMKSKKASIFKFFVDSESGFSLGKSTEINRALRKRIDESDLFPTGDYSLEVSSPGVDMPLKLERQYMKNIGRLLEVDMIDEERIRGRLLACKDGTILLALPRKKGKPEEEKEIKLNDVQQAVVQIEFNKK